MPNRLGRSREIRCLAAGDRAVWGRPWTGRTKGLGGTMKVLITGGTGFIGSRLAQRISGAGRAHRHLGQAGAGRGDPAVRRGIARQADPRARRQTHQDRGRRHCRQEDRRRADRPQGYFGVPPGLDRQRPGRAGFRPRHAGQSRRPPPSARGAARAGLEAAHRVRQLRRGVRRTGHAAHGERFRPSSCRRPPMA